MSKFYVYESRRKGANNPKRSMPIREDEYKAREQLEAMGWRVVEVLGGDPLPEPEPVVEDVVTLDEGEGVDAPELLLPLSDDDRAALVEAGYATIEDLRAATDDDLRAVMSHGKVRRLRKYLKEA